MDMIKIGLPPVMLATLLVVGCGGGGDNRPDESGAQSTPLTLDADGLADKQVALREQGDFDAAMESYWAVSGILFLFGDIEESLQGVSGEPDGSLVEVPDIPPGGTVACANSGGTAVIESSALESGGSYRILFDNCRVNTASHGSYILDGSYLANWSESQDKTDSSIIQNYDITGTQLGAEGQSRDIRVKGSLISKIRELWEPDPESTPNEPRENILVGFDVSIQWPVLEVFVGDDYFAMRDSEFDYVQTAGEVSFGWNVDLISSVLGGSVSFTTPRKVVLADGDECPRYGHLVLESDGKIEMRYGMSSGRGTGMEVLVNDSDVIYLNSCSAILSL
ncbi:hypothetical protein QVZ43_13085 [Marinobacter sp. chi1]|uniref:Lipoprotein n=1 Tax=Marinobacter suaedae TaxID=3057675 RepID=A0ABT8W339_9GAMM|nr:hypothetical protein [Marinobacter sp. chi1]MDO3722654.1 hypothetical protein [Marinobacter sp. chi1]